MVDHSFGGPWTERKLKCLRDYLNAYRTIFTSNPKARYFCTWYVDAFAGTGSRTTASDLPLLDAETDAEAKEYQDGSAKIALGLTKPFDNYLFIEKSRKRAGELHAVIKSDFAPLSDRSKFRIGDANTQLSEWCAERDWTKERAVVFLDPYGMQVNWRTVETLAATKGVDLWYLFPGIARLLRHDGKIDEKWGKRLDALLGTPAWRTRFFQTQVRHDLFGDVENVERTATEEAIESFIHERLATCFGKKVGRGLILRNSKRSPLYFLCFAASNERGAKAALNIANSILDD
jgi:three-Cys-motif partner protein